MIQKVVTGSSSPSAWWRSVKAGQITSP